MSSGSAQPSPAAARTSGVSIGARKAAAGPGGREVFRLAPPVILWWVWVAFAAANFADFAFQGTPSTRFTIVATVGLLTVTAVGYALALRPKVVASETGLTIVNPFRQHQIPWRKVQSVDTGDWVRVHCAPVGAAPAGVSAKPAKADQPAKTVYCWALYVSARAKRRSGRVAPSPRRSGLFRSPDWLSDGAGGQGRLPEEARRLASLPPSKAIAARLGSRAVREAAREAAWDRQRTADGSEPAEVTATWCWPALAAVAVPALLLLAFILA